MGITMRIVNQVAQAMQDIPGWSCIDKLMPLSRDRDGFAGKTPAGLSLRWGFIDGGYSCAAVTKDIKIVRRFLLSGGRTVSMMFFSSDKAVDNAFEDYVSRSKRYDRCRQLIREPLFVCGTI